MRATPKLRAAGQVGRVAVERAVLQQWIDTTVVAVFGNSSVSVFD